MTLDIGGGNRGRGGLGDDRQLDVANTVSPRDENTMGHVTAPSSVPKHLKSELLSYLVFSGCVWEKSQSQISLF